MPKCDLIALRHGCSSVNLLHFFRTLFPKNTSGWLFLYQAAIYISVNIRNIIETDVYRNASQVIVIFVVYIVLLLFNYDCYVISSIIV